MREIDKKRNKYIMKKKIKGLLIIFFATYFYVCALINPVKANDQLIGHVITQVSKGNTEQMVKVLEKEIHAIAYIFAVEFVSVLDFTKSCTRNAIEYGYSCPEIDYKPEQDSYLKATDLRVTQMI